MKANFVGTGLNSSNQKIEEKIVKIEDFSQEEQELKFSQETEDQAFQRIFGNGDWKDRNHYTKIELDFFQKLIMNKIEFAKKELSLLLKDINKSEDNGTDTTYKPYKAFEECSEQTSLDMNVTLAKRQEKFISDLENALLRIRNKTYGPCFVSGQLQKPERLRLVPHSTRKLEFREK